VPAESSNDKSEIEKAVHELLSKMTLGEKIDQMSPRTKVHLWKHLAGYGKYATFDTIENKRLKVPPVRFIDGPRGVNFKNSTAFPVSMARGATWDPELEERVGRAMGYEAAHGGANFFGGVCINVLRHPSWGRAQETFGEDPLHIGQMAVGMVSGLQEHVMACAKHFAANSIEESRLFVDVNMNERTLREVYLPHFKMCVDAGVASIMSAYNKLNGERCSHNRHLLRDILKNEWGFEGFVISDFVYAVRSTEDAANAGLDIEMPFERFYGKQLRQAVQEGRVSEEVINEAATRILRLKLRHSRLRSRAAYERSRVAGPEHQELAREVAQKGIVLLKNQDAVLPLERSALRTIAVVGELANQINLGDRGSSAVRPPYAITPLQGIREAVGSGTRVIFEKGKNLEQARKAAQDADVVIAVVGFTWEQEGEFIKEPRPRGGDRTDLGLLEAHRRLIESVSVVNDRCIIVLESGTAVTMESWKDAVAAILMAWYPGMEGGRAIADVLFGEVNPSGKLPITFPKSTEQLFDFDNRARQVTYDLLHGYRYFDNRKIEPDFHFGFGLSYTQYRYGNLRLSRDTIGRGESLWIDVDVANVGEMAGEETAQLYVGCSRSRVERPQKELKAFGRVALDPGETRTISFELAAASLAFFDTENGVWEIEEGEYVVYVGASSRWEDLLSDRFIISDERSEGSETAGPTSFQEVQE
jgi:beta-glucosidase